MKKIAIVYGGDSLEHDISIVTAFLVMKEWEKAKIPFVPIYLSRKGIFYTGKGLLHKENYESLKGFHPGTFIKKGKKNFFYTFYRKYEIDSVILSLHGEGAEDGTVGGFFDTLEIPSTFSGVENASIMQNKYLTKVLLKEIGVPVVKGKKLTKEEYLNKNIDLASFLEGLEAPFILKPLHLGSSIGVKKAKDIEEISAFLPTLFHMDEEVLIEEAIAPLVEYNIAILGDERDIFLSDIEKVNEGDRVLTFYEKYESWSGNTKKEIPAKISNALAERIQTYASKAFQALSCKGVVRFDFLYQPEKDALYLNEINTIPGSFAYYLFTSKGMSFLEMLEKLKEIAHHQKDKKKRKITRYKESRLTKIMHKK